MASNQRLEVFPRLRAAWVYNRRVLLLGRIRERAGEPSANRVCARLLVGVAAAILLIPGAGWAQLPEQLVVVGDSISSGTFDPNVTRGPAWPEILKEDGQIRIVNVSVYGTAAAQWAAEPAIGLHFTRFARTYGLIALGVNDAIGSRSWTEFGMDLMAIVNTMFAAGAEKVVLLLLPTDTGYPFTHSTRSHYNDLQTSLCAAVDGLECIDASGMPLAFFPPIGPYPHSLHPDAAGHEWLALEVLTGLE